MLILTQKRSQILINVSTFYSKMFIYSKHMSMKPAVMSNQQMYGILTHMQWFIAFYFILSPSVMGGGGKSPSIGFKKWETIKYGMRVMKIGCFSFFLKVISNKKIYAPEGFYNFSAKKGISFRGFDP